MKHAQSTGVSDSVYEFKDMRSAFEGHFALPRDKAL